MEKYCYAFWWRLLILMYYLRISTYQDIIACVSKYYSIIYSLIRIQFCRRQKFWRFFSILEIDTCCNSSSAIQTIFDLPKKKSYFSTLDFLLKFVCAYFENVYKNATIMTSRNKTREKMYFLCFLRNLINIIPIYNSIHNRKIVCK